MAKTTVVNKRRSRYDIDITRRSPTYGNQYVIGQHGTREQVIALHLALWVMRLRSEDGYWRRQLEALRGFRLGCVCKPQACHGDNYVKLLAEDR